MMVASDSTKAIHNPPPSTAAPDISVSSVNSNSNNTTASTPNTSFTSTSPNNTLRHQQPIRRTSTLKLLQNRFLFAKRPSTGSIQPPATSAATSNRSNLSQSLRNQDTIMKQQRQTSQNKDTIPLPTSPNSVNHLNPPHRHQGMPSQKITPDTYNPEDDLDTSSDSDSESESYTEKLRKEEDLKDYKEGGYHPTFIGERYGDSEQYLIVRKLGWGHFSTVWLAYDSTNHKHVAIKIVRSSENYKAAALDEIKILTKINNGRDSHPGKQHIVQLLDHFMHKGPNGEHVCMVFEVLGENLLSLLIRYKQFQKDKTKEIEQINRQEMAQAASGNGTAGHNDSSNNTTENESTPMNAKPESVETHMSMLTDLTILKESYGGLPLTLVKQISKQLLLALDYLHRECGIIHTDLKPENVLVEIKDVEKLVKLLESERRNQKTQKILKKRAEHNRSQSTNFTTSSGAFDRPTSYRTGHTHAASVSSFSNNTAVSGGNESTSFDSGYGDILTPRVTRKRAISIRSSKPLTSPVETTGSVDDFFRSFSFSQRKTNSVSSTSNLGLFSNNISVPAATSSSVERSPTVSQHHFSSNYSLTNDIPAPNNSSILSSSAASGNPSPLMKPLRRNSTIDKKNFSVLATNDPIPEEDQEATSDDDNEHKIHLDSEDDVGSPDVFVDASEEAPGSVPLPVSNPNSPPPPNNNTLQSIASTTSTNTIPSATVNNNSNNNNHNANIRRGSSARRESTLSSHSYHSILNEFDSIISIKIADLGNACWANLHYTNDIQTRQYRAPETILGGRWGCSTDLWSCAALIFELITGDYLFDPKTGSTYNKNDDHLAQIIELLQIWPSKEFLKKCRYSRDFFDKAFQSFRNIAKLKIWTLLEVFLDEYKLNEVDAMEISKFLLCMLEFEPKRRVDAGSLSNCPWLSDVLIDESIDRKFGLRGQDIPGYYCEYHGDLDNIELDEE